MANGEKKPSYTDAVISFQEKIDVVHGRIGNSNEKMNAMKTEIIEAINEVKLTVAPMRNELDNHTKEIDNLREDAKLKTWFLGIFTIVTGIVTGIVSTLSGK